MPHLSHLSSILHKLPNARVLCVGDVMLDRFIEGDVSRLSPEAPVPVMLIKCEVNSLGGAGNVIRNFASLGIACGFVSLVGKDKDGQEVQGQLKSLVGINADIIEVSHRTTTRKSRYVSGGQHLLRIDREVTTPLPQKVYDQIIKAVEQKLAQADVLILSDYDKGVLTPTIISHLIANARAQGKVIIVDPKGCDYNIYRGAHILTPNLRELSAATGRVLDSDESLVEAGRGLIEACGIDALLVTRSKDGMTLIEKNKEEIHIPTHALDVFDVSGAGDTVVTVLSAATAVKASLKEAAQLANIAAGIAVGKVGTAAVNSEELYAAIHETEIHESDLKILTLEQAIESVHQWRRDGLCIGFTNGCFDLLHPGHIALLRNAKVACDRLIVGLNSDASITRSKGDSRPIQSEAARSTVLASLNGIDGVVIFEEDTPIDLIRALHPEVLIKGSDYTIDKVVGADLVQGYGGKVLLVDLVPGHSTSRTVQQIAR